MKGYHTFKMNLKRDSKLQLLQVMVSKTKLVLIFFLVTALQSVSASECSSPLGVEKGETALSSDSSTHHINPNVEGKLNYVGGRGGWCQETSNRGYLQVDFYDERFVTGVATQGSGQGDQGQVLKYKLQFSVDKTEWWDYMEDGQVKIFNGNLGDKNEVVRNNLSVPVRALLIRFRPLLSRRLTCLRVEVYGCKACGEPLGLEDGRIPDSAFSTYKILKTGYEAYRGRLNQITGGKSWCPPGKSDEAFLRVDLGKVHTIDGIMTQGNPNKRLYYSTSKTIVPCNSTDPRLVRTTVNNVTTCANITKQYSAAWVKTYRLDYSIDGVIWKTYGENGIPNMVLTANRDGDSIKRTRISPKLRARYVSYRPAISWYNHCSRLEILGCEACMGEIGISHGRIPNNQITSSSNAGSGFEPWLARLKSPQRAWCSNKSDTTPYLQVDLWNTHEIRYISTQGFSSTSNSWVEKYAIDFSTDGDEWFTYKENNLKKVFQGNSDSDTVVKINFTSPIYAVLMRVKPVNWTGESACLRLELYGCRVASDALGMETGEIGNSAIIANHFHSYHRYYEGRLNHKNGFEANMVTDSNQPLFFRVDLGPSAAVVTGIATQGTSYSVRRYTLKFSDDRLDWMPYTDRGHIKVFDGNYDKHTTVRHNFRVNVTARYVELVVVEGSQFKIGLRMEIYGIKLCEQPLGVANGFLSNDSFTALTSKPDNPPANARLNGPGAWCGSSISSYLQINLKRLHRITAIATQGNPNAGEWVKTYNLSYRAESPDWEAYQEHGQVKAFTGVSTMTLVVIERLKRAILAVMVRLTPITWKESMCMRVEIYGCPETRCSSPVGMTTFQIAAEKITASSSLGHSYRPSNGRLNMNLGNGAWCAANHDQQRYLQVDLSRMYVITGFSSQGKHRLSKDGLGDAWVTSYSVSYSKDLFHWSFVQEVNYTMVFTGNDEINSTVTPGIVSSCIRTNGTVMNTTTTNDPVANATATNDPVANATATNGTVANGTATNGIANGTATNGTVTNSTATNATATNGTAINGTVTNGTATNGTVTNSIATNATLTNDTATNETVSNCTTINGTVTSDAVKYILLKSFNTKIFLGNNAINITVKHVVEKPFKSKAVRFHPDSWFNMVCMRVELYGCKDCFTPLGMEDGKIQNSAIKANNWNSYYEPYRARLNNEGRFWRSDLFYDRPFLQIYVGPQTKHISAIATEAPSYGWIKVYTVSYSPNGGDWMEYTEDGKIKFFRGNTDKYTIVKNDFAYNLKAQYLKIDIKETYVYSIRLKVELYGCTADCYEPLGLHSNQSIPDINFQADSTDITGGHYPYNARLNQLATITAWCPADSKVHHFLVVNLGKSSLISQIAMQGYDNKWTKMVRIYYKDDFVPVPWTMYTDHVGHSDLPANTDGLSIKRIFIKYPFKASHIKLYALDLEIRSCMRVEIYGCQDCQKEITYNQEFVTQSGMQASSYFDPNFKPTFGSMRNGGPNLAWCASSNNDKQYLQFDNLLNIKITGIYTTGFRSSPHDGNGSWVKNYRLEYSTDGKAWSNYLENGVVKIFNGSESHQDVSFQVVDKHLVARFVRLVPTEWTNWICMRASLKGCPDCSSALGLETKKIRSIRGTFYHSYRHPSEGILHHPYGFVGKNIYSMQPFLEIQVKNSGAIITAVAVQPVYYYHYYVCTYYLSYTLYGEQWFSYNENGARRYFKGYRDRETAVKTVLSRPITIRLIRFNPLTWRNHPGLRVELYGCQACEKPLGMRSGLIKNTSLTASSYKVGHEPWLGRLGSNGIWCSKQFDSNHDQYLQIDLESLTQVTGLLTEGDALIGRVRNIVVSYHTDAGFWRTIRSPTGQDDKRFDVNYFINELTKIEFPRPITTRYVRINPQAWITQRCMRVELIGCRDSPKENCTSRIGLEAGYVKNESISASSSLGPDYQPYFARLNTNMLGGGWCAIANNSNQHLQVNLVEQHKIKKFFLQGVILQAGSSSAWLTKFSIQYSLDGSIWSTYSQQNNEVFNGCGNSNEIAEFNLENPFIARYVRILPREWHNWVCIRTELAGCKVFAVPVGMETFEVANDLMSGSDQQSYQRFEEGRLYFHDRWMTTRVTGDEYLEITLQPFGKIITAVAIQGHSSRWATLYTLTYSVDGTNWIDYKVDGRRKMFKGGKDMHVVSRSVLPRPILASHIRIIPKQWVYGIALRTELYGFDSCIEPLNVSSLPSSSFVASSSMANHEPWRAKFGSPHNESWCPLTTSSEEYLEIDLGDTYVIGAVATEGNLVKNYWMLSFTLGYRETASDSWHFYTKQVFNVATNISFRSADPAVPRYLAKMHHKLQARYLRIYPEKMLNHPCLRLEVYGCQACVTELGMMSYMIKDDAITASGCLNPRSIPSMARLHSKRGMGAWCAGTNERNPFLQIDLFLLHEVRLIASQGRQSTSSAWVEEFTLSFREDSQHWQNYTEGSITKVFTANNDGFSVVKHRINMTRVRYLRIHPVKWRNEACLRLEIYGCVAKLKNKGDALGMQDLTIPNSAITASYWQSKMPSTARLFLKDGGWFSNLLSKKNFLLIDLGLNKTVITRIATQGYYHGWHSVLEYHLSLSREGIFWFRYKEKSQEKVFSGNSYKDTQTPVEHRLHHEVITRYLKFEVLKAMQNIGMRVEAYGYRVCPSSLIGSRFNSSTKDYVVTSSGNLSVDPFVTPGVSWCAEFNDSRQYLQVEFKTDVQVSGITLETIGSTGVVLFYASSGHGFRSLQDGKVTKKFYNGKHVLKERIVAIRIRITPLVFQESMCLHFDIHGLHDLLNASIGFEDGRIQDNALSASTQLTPSTRPSFGRVSLDNVHEAWCAGEDNDNQYLSLDLGYIHVLGAIATQGRHTTGLDSWVTSFSIRYSKDGVEWQWCIFENGTVKIFEGNTNYYLVVKSELPQIISARYVEVHPLSWKGSICMRVELYGYAVCVNSLGMNSGQIPDFSISATSSSSNRRLPRCARLHRHVLEGGWCAKTADQHKYLEIDLGMNKVITGFATQGSLELRDAFVKNYQVSYRPDKGSWTFYTENATTKVFVGNVDQHEVVTHILKEKIISRYFRFIVKSWNVQPCLRVELLGCEVPVIDGGYTNFTEWTECSVKCGGGTQNRTRNCTNPEPSDGGRNCTDVAPDTEVRRCNVHLCPAPNITSRQIFSSDEQPYFVVNNCSTYLNKTFDFGDLTVTSTFQCIIQHRYRRPGIYELRVSIPKHHSSFMSLYIQDKIRSLKDVRSTKASIVFERFWLYWELNRGTFPVIKINYGNDLGVYNFNLGDVKGKYIGSSSHNFTSTGVYNITAVASNLVSRKMFFTKVIVEERVNITNMTVKYLGKFDRHYQIDKLSVNVKLDGGSNPHYRLYLGNGLIISNGLNSSCLYSYPQPGIYNLTIEVYNNASRANITTQIIAHPVIPINSYARLTIKPNIYLTPTLIDIDLTIADPFECFCDFGDGNSTTMLSTDNLTVIPHVYKNVGVYPVTVTCSNHKSKRVFRANAIVQKAISGLTFTNNAPKEMNETVTFTISSTDWGTDSCYFVTLGDGTSHAFGKHHCRSKYPQENFKEITNDTYIMTNMYYEVKVFYSNLHAWNLVSEYKMVRHLPILKMSCNYPNTSILNIGKSIENPSNFTRLDTTLFETWIKIDCRATQLKDLSWTFVNVSKDGVHEEGSQSLGTQSTLTIYPKTFDYGIYLLRFNVCMRGQEGVCKQDQGYFKVMPNDLRPIIDGGNLILRSYIKIAYFDGSHSFDPDYYGKSGFEYYWYMTNETDNGFEIDSVLNSRPIKDSPPFNEVEFTDMSAPRRLYKSGPNIQLFAGRLRINVTYAIYLVVTKTIHGVARRKESVQYMRVVEGDPPAIGIKCTRNCKWKVSGSDKLSLSGSCNEESPVNKVAYSWELQIADQDLSTSKSKSLSSHSWTTLKNLRNLTATDLNQKFIVIKPNTLEGERLHRLILTGKMYGRTAGKSYFQFIVNKPPHGGKCTVDIPSGFADSTNFTFNCFDWKDDDQPLSYEDNYRSVYGLATLIYYGKKNLVKTKLPVGNPNKNFTIIFYVKVMDALGAYVEFFLSVQVKLPPGQKGNLINKFSSMMNGNNSILSNMIKDGNIQEFTQEVNSLASVINVFAEEKNGSEADRKERQEMRSTIVKMLYSVEIKSLSALNQNGPTLAATTAKKEEVSVETQKLLLQSFENMANLFENKVGDPDVSSTSIEDAGVTIVFCMGNLIAAAGDSARVYGEPSPKDAGGNANNSRGEAKSISKKAYNVLNKASKILLRTKVPGEQELVIKALSMSVALSRNFPDKFADKPFGDGDATVGLPPSDTIFSNDTLSNTSHVDIKLMRFDDNPMTWDESSKDISSSMVSFTLQDDGANDMNVFGLSSFIDIYIPRKVSRETDPANNNFIKNEVGAMSFHKYNWTVEGMPVSLLIEGKGIKFEVYIKKGERPNDKRDKVFKTIPDYSSCKTNDNGVYSDCVEDPFIVTIDDTVVKESGLYYLNLKNLQTNKIETKVRERRDCGSSPREKRSCIKYKDPPPKPTTLPPGVIGGEQVTVVPIFDPLRDITYTLQNFKSPCKYWNKKKEIWTSEGCKTGRNTKLELIHCQCNHLTGFGGGMVVAPNPIDFDRVWAGFGNISDNMSVLLTICTAFGLYIIIGIWCRKKDKQDTKKGGVTVIEADIGSHGVDSHHYLITVQTGAWKNSATTAKVSMNLFGERGQSGPISLKDESKQLFARGATNEFHLTLPESLGSLLYLRVWHDMTGEDSSWYLSYVIIKDLSTNQQWIFVCDRWLALEKDDGLVDRLILVSGEKELKNFKTLFRTKTSQDLFDGHLWLSVIAKPPKSNFTRLQRLTCCMSLLFTTMMTSAMFFNVGGEPDTSTIALGPLRFSVRQLMIGIQSSFIAIPGNVIIIQIFRNARPKQVAKEVEEDIQNVEEEKRNFNDDVEEKGKKHEGIPFWCTYIAWTLAFLMTMVSAMITLFYSMMWGKEISDQWLTSMLVSFFQDAFVTQPIKVCGVALFVAAVLKTLPKDFAGADKNKKTEKKDKLDGSSEDPKVLMFDESLGVEPPDQESIEKAREYKLKESQMYGIMKENTFHAVFLFMLVVISYTDRDPMSYLQKKTLEDALNSPVSDANSFWTYLDDTLLPFAFDGQTVEKNIDDEGFTAEKNFYIVGMPRLRQLRVKTGLCDVNYTVTVCTKPYSAFQEETSFFLPGWKKLTNLTPSSCPEPWKYKGFMELNGVPYWGQAAVYGGGGFTANLGYNIYQAKKIIGDLKSNKWIDSQTRAIFIEFTVYDAYVNIFSSVTYLVEMQGIGGSDSLLRIETFHLYQNTGPGQTIVIFCQFSVVIIVIILAYINAKKIYHMRKEYFKSAWNTIQLIVIILTFSAVALVVIRLIDAKRTMNKLEENPFLFINFQYTTKWAEVNTYVIALVVFLTTLKFLHLMSFNHHIIVLYKTVKHAKPSLGLLAVEAFILFASLVSFAYLTFGSVTDGFGSVFLTVQTLLAMLLGKAYFIELSTTEPLLGPVFFCVFVFLMVFFLMNMFMAILMDCYEMAKEEVAEEHNEQFEIADFMIERFKVTIGIGKPPSRAPWQDPSLKYIPGVNEKTRKRLELQNSMEKLPSRINGIQRTLNGIYSMEEKTTVDSLTFAEIFISQYSSGRLEIKEKNRTLFIEYLQEE